MPDRDKVCVSAAALLSFQRNAMKIHRKKAPRSACLATPSLDAMLCEWKRRRSHRVKDKPITIDYGNYMFEEQHISGQRVENIESDSWIKWNCFWGFDGDCLEIMSLWSLETWKHLQHNLIDINEIHHVTSLMNLSHLRISCFPLSMLLFYVFLSVVCLVAPLAIVNMRILNISIRCSFSFASQSRFSNKFFQI